MMIEPNTTRLPNLPLRKRFSEGRLVALEKELAGQPLSATLPSLCVYATGSYARGEASEHSDIDLFFLHDGRGDADRVSRLAELQFFAQIINIAQKLQFPAFSNDGEFLKLLYLEDMLAMLGGRDDDSQNFFTARMLLLLESKPVFNEDRYRQTVEQVIEAYFRDYPDHSSNFKPVFLTNDILRFWKTLCLNYEHRRYRPRNNEELKRKQQVKNFKLKFSRLMTCFGSVAAVCAMPSPIDPENIMKIVEMAPIERLIYGSQTDSRTLQLCDAVLDEYNWFLELTALSTEELHSLFNTKSGRVEKFERAAKFGALVYDVVRTLADKNDYGRFLLV